ncbi:MAG: T9SS type A sorting domain-containing protein [Bacteroidia bacterium]
MNGDGKDDVFTHNSSYLKIYFNVFNSNITSTDEGQMKECEIYPNPTGGRIHFTKQCEGNSAMHISIRGIDGRLIYEENTKNDFVDLPEATQRGLYFLIVKTEAETYNFRLILK